MPTGAWTFEDDCKRFTDWMAHTFATELAQWRQAISEQHLRYPAGPAVIRLMSFALPRTVYYAYAPTEDVSYTAWIENPNIPPVLRNYVSNLHSELVAIGEAKEQEKLDLAQKEREASQRRDEEAREAATAERTAIVNEIRTRATQVLSEESDLVSKFLEIAYRKVRTRDEYGEEQWAALDKEMIIVLKKLASRRPTLNIDPPKAGGPTDPASIELRRNEVIEHSKPADINRNLRNFDSYNRPTLTNNIHWQLKTLFNSHYEAQQQTAGELRRTEGMSGGEFELYVMDRLIAAGATDVSGTPASGDQGADILFARNGLRVVVQCKRHTSAVGNKAIQEAHAAKGFYGCDRAWVVSSSTFTSSARQLADTLDVTLVSGTDLAKVDSIVSHLEKLRKF